MTTESLSAVEGSSRNVRCVTTLTHPNGSKVCTSDPVLSNVLAVLVWQDYRDVIETLKAARKAAS